LASRKKEGPATCVTLLGDVNTVTVKLRSPQKKHATDPSQREGIGSPSESS